MALLYQHHGGPTVRATLGVFFPCSATLSVVGYALTGEITADRVLLALALLPAMLVGLWASRHFHDLVDHGAGSGRRCSSMCAARRHRRDRSAAAL